MRISPDPIAYDAERLLQAFPSAIKFEAKVSTRQLRFWIRPDHRSFQFPLNISGEQVLIPQRLHFWGFSNPFQSNSTVNLIKSCLRTRSIDGFERHNALRRIISANEPWSIPFVIALVGEYVIEILEEIDRHIGQLDAASVQGFLLNNPEYHRKTRQRVASYWHAFYRHIPQNEYAGFRIMAILDEMVRDQSNPHLNTRSASDAEGRFVDRKRE